MRQSSALGLSCGGLLAMAAAIGIGRFVYTPILPIMRDALQWSNADAGLVASANFLGYLVGALLAARPVAADRQRTWLVASLLVSALTTAAMAAGSSVVALMGLRLVGGGASAFVIVLASTLVLERLSATHHGALSAIPFAGVGGGVMLSAVMVSALTAAGAGWQALWIGSGAIALLATALAAVLIPGQPSTSAAAAGPALQPPAKGLPALILAYGLFGFGYVITATFLVAMVRMTPQLAPLEGWIWILFGFAALPSVAIWSRIGSRIGLMTAFAVACLAEAVGVAISVEWVAGAGILVSTLLLGGTFMGITALGLMAARQLSGARSQRAIALMTASFAAGQMIGPSVAGALFDRLGSFRAPSLLAALALVVAAGLVPAFRSSVARRDDPIAAGDRERTTAAPVSDQCGMMGGDAN